MSELAYFARLLGLGKISRREFIARASALGGAAAVTSVLPGAAAAATPVKGGTLRMAFGRGSTNDTLDPATYLRSFTQTLGFGLRNNLTEVDNDGKLVPELAASFEASPDAKVWTFKLRKGVEFHNGKTLDAEDVVASINHHRGEYSRSAAKAILKPIAELKADGKDTVVFNMAEGNADIPFIVADTRIGIMPAKDGMLDPSSGVGTGGYVIENFKPGVRATLKRNRNYWKSGRAHFDFCEMRAIADLAERTTELNNGEIDVMDRVDPKTVQSMAGNKYLRIEETGGTRHFTFAMRTDTAPFDNNHVRLALKFGIDREALLKAILRGHGALGNDHPIGRSNPYHAADLPQRKYDPDRAKFHLKQAGLSSLKVDLSAADVAFPGAIDAAVLYQEHAATAGIEINVVREPNDGYWTKVWMKKTFCAVSSKGRPTEDWMFSTAYADGAAWNDSFWKHEKFNQLLVAARAELDASKRRQQYFDMQKIVSEEGGVVIPMFANYVFAMSKKVQHDVMAANMDLDGQKGMERWWFA